MKYQITVEFECNKELPDEVIQELTMMCEMQIESLTDGSFNEKHEYVYESIESGCEKMGEK